MVKTVEVLRSGGLVVCPSDTVYGLLVDATNEEAVKKLIAFKERPVGKAISVFLDGFEMMGKVVDTSMIKPATKSLIPGPYTFILPSLHYCSKLLESEKGTLGVRYIGQKVPNSKFQVPNNYQLSTFNSQLIPADFVTTLVHEFGRPVTATSANLAGKSSCYSIDAFMHQLSDKKQQMINLVIDGGELPRHEPSTVLDLTMQTPHVLRASAAGQTTITHSVEETMKVAETFISSLLGEGGPREWGKGLVVYLHGDLGAGKTHFVKGIARHLGFDRVVSPTYVGVQEYVNDQVKLYHVDLYNCQTQEDVDALQLNKLITPSPASIGGSFPKEASPGIPSLGRGDHAVVGGVSQNKTTIICIEWSEVGHLSYPGKHVFIEYIKDDDRHITII
jgi:L-threonylcarbamoyladenylate synthase